VVGRTGRSRATELASRHQVNTERRSDAPARCRVFHWLPTRQRADPQLSQGGSAESLVREVGHGVDSGRSERSVQVVADHHRHHRLSRPLRSSL
jgi:hypothetical protein